MPADEWRARHLTVGERWCRLRRSDAPGQEDSHPAVGPGDSHRVEDLFRVDADAGAGLQQPVAVDRDVQAGQRR